MIKKLEFKNLLSFGGDVVNGIDFSLAEISEISGANGLGKSNIMLLLKMATYFDYPTKLTNIVNDHSVEGYLTVFYENGFIARHEYTAKQGLLSLKVYSSEDNFENDIQHDTGGIQATKDWLCINQFPIPKKMFYNVYIPSIDKFKSFIGMSPQDSREIRDELFSLSMINVNLKKTQNASNELIREMKIKLSQKEGLDTTISELEEQIEKVLVESKNENDAKIKTLSTTISESESKLGTERENISNLKLELKGFVTQLEIWDTFLTQEKLSTEEKSLIKTKLELEFLLTKVDGLEKDIDGIKKLDNNIKFDELDEEIKVLASKQVTGGKTIKLEEARLLSLNYFLSKDALENTKVELENAKNILAANAEAEANEKLQKRNEEIQKDYAVKMEVNKADKRFIEIINLGENCPTCDQCVPESLKEQRPELERRILERTDKLKTLLAEHEANKTKISNNNSELDVLKASVTTAEASVTTSQKFFDGLTKSEYETRPEVVSDAKKLELEASIKSIKSNFESNSKPLSEKTGRFNSMEKFDGDFSIYSNINLLECTNELTIVRESVEKLKQDKTRSETMVAEHTSKLEGVEPVLEPLETLDSIKLSKEEVEGKIDTSQTAIDQLDTEISMNKKSLEEAEGYDVNVKAKPLIELKDSKSLELQKLIGSMAVENSKLEKLKVLEYVFSDEGMKKWILAKIRRGFTNQVNKDLNKFGLTAQFDDDFSVKLFKRGKEMPTISTGQKKVFDTIVCINSILLYSKKENTKLPVILDECMSNLRLAWAERLLSIMNEKLVTKGFNVKFVNHEKLNINLSQKKIKLSDKGLYTAITIES